jgi:hypothetical protein
MAGVNIDRPFKIESGARADPAQKGGNDLANLACGTLWIVKEPEGDEDQHEKDQLQEISRIHGDVPPACALVIEFVLDPTSKPLQRPTDAGQHGGYAGECERHRGPIRDAEGEQGTCGAPC